jgi:hypothetical protein
MLARTPTRIAHKPKPAGALSGWPIEPVLPHKRRNRELMEGGEVEIQVRQVLAAFVDEQLPVQAVIRGAQVRTTSAHTTRLVVAEPHAVTGMPCSAQN